MLWGEGGRRAGKRGEETKNGTGLANLSQVYDKARGRERPDWALSGLERTGRAACTYRGSCDRTHSVFLVLFWWDMDLEKQKRLGHRHVWTFRVKLELSFRESFCCCFFLSFSSSTLQWSRCEKEARDSHNSRWTRVHLEANPAIKDWGNAARHRINNSLNYEANKARSKENKKKSKLLGAWEESCGGPAWSNVVESYSRCCLFYF